MVVSFSSAYHGHGGGGGGGTYREICTVYTDYMVKKYGEAIVVFDGYGESSTKDMVHQRRAIH